MKNPQLGLKGLTNFSLLDFFQNFAAFVSLLALGEDQQ